MQDLARLLEFYESRAVLEAMEGPQFGEGFWHTRFTFLDGQGRRIDETEHLVSGTGFDGTAPVLDFGCGLGGGTRAIASLSGIPVIGLNLSPRQVEAARRHTSDAMPVRFVVYDGHRLPFADEAFGAVLAQESLCHAPNREELFREIARVLRPRGLLHAQDWFHVNVRSAEEHETLIGPIDRCFETYLGSMSEYASQLRACGFREVETLDAADLPESTLARAFAVPPEAPSPQAESGAAGRLAAGGLALARAFEAGRFTIGFVRARRGRPG
jgi:SAM-dependent methyltransferase